MVYSAKYCRGIVKHSIHMVGYTKVLFRQYLNMLVRFLNNCDYRGRYVDLPIPENLIIARKATDYYVEQCMAEVNRPTWGRACYKYC